LLVTKLEIRFVLQAISIDLNDELTYTINGTIEVTDTSIQHLVGIPPFIIVKNELQLNFGVQDSAMTGMFVFKVLVTNKGQF
jgi:hypothetical protein